MPIVLRDGQPESPKVITFSFGAGGDSRDCRVSHRLGIFRLPTVLHGNTFRI